MFYRPENGHGLPHNPFKALVSPRPIGWISTRDGEGRYNLAPYSFFMAIADNPPLVLFSSVGMKDSARGAKETGEFVVNVASRDLAEAVNRSSAPAPSDVSEFELAGLTPAPCNIVKAPRVAEAVASMECKVVEVREAVGLGGRQSGSHVVTGEVVGVHIAERALNEQGRFDVTRARLLARLGYMDYLSTDEVFEIQRPSWPLKDT